MKKLLIAAAAILFIFGGQAGAEASTVDNLNVKSEQTQELGWWSHFRDKHILGRETENERNDRKERRYNERHYSDHHGSHHGGHGHGGFPPRR